MKTWQFRVAEPGFQEHCQQQFSRSVWCSKVLTGAGGSGISGVLHLCFVTWKKTTPQLSSEILLSTQLLSLWFSSLN